MELSRLQITLLQLFQIIGMTKDQIIATMLILKTEEMEKVMLDYIEMNPNATPSQILRKAVEINPEPDE